MYSDSACQSIELKTTRSMSYSNCFVHLGILVICLKPLKRSHLLIDAEGILIVKRRVSWCPSLRSCLPPPASISKRRTPKAHQSAPCKQDDETYYDGRQMPCLTMAFGLNDLRCQIPDPYSLLRSFVNQVGRGTPAFHTESKSSPPQPVELFLCPSKIIKAYQCSLHVVSRPCEPLQSQNP